MTTIRVLDPQDDQDLLKTAWHWQDSAPQWFRDTQDCWNETFADFCESSVNEPRFVIFEGETLIAFVRLCFAAAEPLTYAVHLHVAPRADFMSIARGCVLLRNHIFDTNVKRLFCWLPVKNRSIINLCSGLGFQKTGLLKYAGFYTRTNRAIEWIQLAMNAPAPPFVPDERETAKLRGFTASFESAPPALDATVYGSGATPALTRFFDAQHSPTT